jgi:hypothetical protein
MDKLANGDCKSEATPMLNRVSSVLFGTFVGTSLFLGCAGSPESVSADSSNLEGARTVVASVAVNFAFGAKVALGSPAIPYLRCFAEPSGCSLADIANGREWAQSVCSHIYDSKSRAAGSTVKSPKQVLGLREDSWRYPEATQYRASVASSGGSSFNFECALERNETLRVPLQTVQAAQTESYRGLFEVSSEFSVDAFSILGDKGVSTRVIEGNSGRFAAETVTFVWNPR